MSARRARDDIIALREANDMIASAENAEPIESTEQNDPTDAIEKAEPTLPIDSTEPFEQIESAEPSELKDHRERRDSWIAGTGAVLGMATFQAVALNRLSRRWVPAPLREVRRRRARAVTARGVRA